MAYWYIPSKVINCLISPLSGFDWLDAGSFINTDYKELKFGLSLTNDWKSILKLSGLAIDGPFIDHVASRPKDSSKE